MIFSVVKKNWKVYTRYFPIVLFTNRVLDSSLEILGFWLFSKYLFNNTIKTTNEVIGDYFSYAAIGIIFFNLMVATLMNVGRTLMIEKREGTLESLLISPCTPEKYFLGVFIEQIPRTFLEFFISFFIAIIFGANLLSISFSKWVFFYIYISFISFLFSVFLSNIMLYLQDTFITQNTLFIFIFFISGITFPREILPAFILNLSFFSPFSQLLDLFRDIEKSSLISILKNTIFYYGILLSFCYFKIGIYMYNKITK